MGGVTFEIVLDQNGARAGSTVKGYVLMTVDKDVKGAALDLTFSGVETASVRYTETTGSGDNRRTVTRTARSSRNIIQTKIPTDRVPSFIQPGGRIAAGLYQVPFVFQLPSSLPGSMHISKGSSDSCSITYKIKVILKGSGVMWNYHSEQVVSVSSKPQTLNEDPLPYSAPPATEQVNFCCCFNQGSVSLGGHMDDTKVVKGQSAKVSVSCRNHSSVGIKSVSAQMSQLVEWRAHGHYSSTSRNLMSHDYTKPLLLQGSLAIVEKRNQINVNHHEELTEIHRELVENRHAALFTIPSNVLCSYSSGLITVRHTLYITVATDGMCLSQPQIKIPVSIEEANTTASPQGGGEPPMVTAEVIGVEEDVEPEIAYTPPQYGNATLTSVVYAPASGAYTGGKIVDGDDDGDEEEIVVNASMNRISSSVDQEPSLSNLLREMGESVADYDIVQSKLRDAAWESIFRNLSPDAYGRVVEQVDLDFDQPRVAQLVAEFMGSQFRCAHVVAALRTTSEWNRSSVVEKVLSFVSGKWRRRIHVPFLESYGILFDAHALLFFVLFVLQICIKRRTLF